MARPWGKLYASVSVSASTRLLEFESSCKQIERRVVQLLRG